MVATLPLTWKQTARVDTRMGGGTGDVREGGVLGDFARFGGARARTGERLWSPHYNASIRIAHKLVEGQSWPNYFPESPERRAPIGDILTLLPPARSTRFIPCARSPWSLWSLPSPLSDSSRTRRRRRRCIPSPSTATPSPSPS